ncbi:hypothetical protein J27TS7_10440 [Paenibacillus dendritiformis]|nr:hypothetical protein J27TS7_10440 [Paenibacillus dendritiformis]
MKTERMGYWAKGYEKNLWRHQEGLPVKQESKEQREGAESWISLPV